MNALIFIYCLVLSATGTWTLAAPSDCDCPVSSLPCHVVAVNDPECQCKVCLTECRENTNICGPGKKCVLKSLFYRGTEVGKTAECESNCDCPVNKLPCHNIIFYDPECDCEVCLTRCYAKEDVCGRNKTCVLKPVYYRGSKVGDTAECVPFTKCEQKTCSNKCPASGYYIDSNGCQTCLCKDPCKEKCPKGKCNFWSINPGTEPNYHCI